MRAAIYLRQSVDRTGEELGISRQRQDCERLAAERGWTVIATVIDNDTSASRGKRRGFSEVLALIDKQAVDVVVVWAVDRLVRRMADLEDVIERCERCGVKLAAVSGDLDLSTDQGRLVGRILASVARGEVERKGARQRRAYQQAAELGRPPGGPVPFGFRPDRRTHHPKQALAVRNAYEALLGGGTLAGIARRWNAAGLTSGRVRIARHNAGEPSRWCAETVRALLMNPRNAALRAYRGEIVGRADWEPIVGEETWRATVALLSDPSRRGGPPSPRRLLSGIAACGVCHGPVVAGTILPTYHTYRCRSNGHVSRRGDHVDDYVSSIVINRLAGPEAVDLITTNDGGSDVGLLRAEALSLRSRMKSATLEFANDDTVTPAQLRAITSRLKERLNAVEEQLADAGRVSVLGPLVAAATEDQATGAVERVREVWDSWLEEGTDRCRAVIDMLMSITLQPPGSGCRKFDPNTVEIVPKR
ncbi:MAG: recombinase family protein [Pseudonocardiaceae bacterium]